MTDDRNSVSSGLGSSTSEYFCSENYHEAFDVYVGAADCSVGCFSGCSVDFVVEYSVEY